MPSGQEDTAYAVEQALLGYQGEDRVISCFEKQDELASVKVTDIRCDSQFPTLDRLIEGFRGGELIIVSGPTKHGKTTWCKTLTRNFGNQQLQSLWFSYEMAPREFLSSFTMLPPFYLPAMLKGRSTSWIGQRCHEAKLKYNVRAVFIDHLHFLVDMARMKNPSLEIGALVRQLKGMAVELNLVVFLICHLTKLKFDDEPTESDLRDSSFIAQDADSTLMIFRKKDPRTREFEAEATLTVRNHRRTGVMAKKVPLVMVKGWHEEEATWTRP